MKSDFNCGFGQTSPGCKKWIRCTTHSNRVISKTSSFASNSQKFRSEANNSLSSLKGSEMLHVFCDLLYIQLALELNGGRSVEK